jgi:chlorite dismutase
VTEATSNERLWTFAGGDIGAFRVLQTVSVCGATLPDVTRLNVFSGVTPKGAAAVAAPGFVLRGVVSNERYATRAEKKDLVQAQAAIGRPEAQHGALIPIKKNAAWWALTQDERRRIFEDDSNHIAIGMRALPAIARRLHHCRDLASAEPFDFLTWFDFAPQLRPQFDDLLGALRATKEWEYVEREVEVWVER